MLLTLLILSLILNALFWLLWQRADWRALVAERRMALAERDLATALARQNELGRRTLEAERELAALRANPLLGLRVTLSRTPSGEWIAWN